MCFMKIDAHVHLSSACPIGKILPVCDRIGIDKVCLLATWDRLAEAVREAPDRVIPLARFYLDEYPLSDLDRFREAGMMGLKIIGPEHPYDDERYFPAYEKAQALGFPILFHTGIVGRMKRRRICNNMRPIHLDDIGRCFPDLKMIMAHLGNPWYEEGAMSLRYNRNMVCDLSGSTLKKKTPDFIRSLFWWDRPGHPYQADGKKHPFEKIVFGTDVGPEWMEDACRDYQNLMDAMEVPAHYREKIMGGTAAELFGLEA
jgi:uncharacterized protein